MSLYARRDSETSPLLSPTADDSSATIHVASYPGPGYEAIAAAAITTTCAAAAAATTTTTTCTTAGVITTYPAAILYSIHSLWSAIL